jgi:hypothetical protein
MKLGMNSAAKSARDAVAAASTLKHMHMSREGHLRSKNSALPTRTTPRAGPYWGRSTNRQSCHASSACCPRSAKNCADTRHLRLGTSGVRKSVRFLAIGGLRLHALP